jgi:hypothetical protein
MWIMGRHNSFEDSILAHSGASISICHTAQLRTTGADESWRRRYTSRARMDSRYATRTGRRTRVEYHGLPIGARKQHVKYQSTRRTYSRTTRYNASPCRGNTRMVGQNHANDTHVSSVIQEVGLQVLRHRVPTTYQYSRISQTGTPSPAPSRQDNQLSVRPKTSF